MPIQFMDRLPKSAIDSRIPLPCSRSKSSPSCNNSGFNSLYFARKVPFRHERLAASTSSTCITGKISWEIENNFLGSTMIPKLQKRQTLSTMPLWKTEAFTLNYMPHKLVNLSDGVVPAA